VTAPIAPPGSITAPTGPSEAAAAPRDAKKAKQLEIAAREFEQIFVRAMLKGTPIAKKGDAYGDLAVDAMAKSVTEGRGLGLGELIRRTIEKSEMPLKVSK
jgi:Rod binding domain-containing protein